MRLVEGNLAIDFSKNVQAHIFDVDGKGAPGLGGTFSSVDIIAELPSRAILIEIKDPDDPNIEPERLLEVQEEFASKLIDGSWHVRLARKFRDTFLYHWAERTLWKKPIYYAVLIGMQSLTAAELLHSTEALARKLPLGGPNGRAWRRPFVQGCGILNIDSWNRTFPEMPVSRLP